MAGGKSTTFSNDILKLILNAVPIANLADNASASPLGSLYLSLHTGDPGVGGSQTSFEAAYGAYARQPVARSAAGLTVAGNSATLTAAILFPTATSGSETETWAALGTLVSGTGKILYRGPITPSLVVSTGVQPQLTTSTTFTES